MNKLGQKVLVAILALLLATGSFIQTNISVNAVELSDTTEMNAYVDTTEYRSEESIVFSASQITGDLTSFTGKPIYDMKSNRLILPRIEGYTVELFGSDRKETVGLDGRVTRPLNTQDVKLLYKITNNETKESVVTTENAIIRIPGQVFDFDGNNTKPTVVPALREWVPGNGKIDLSKEARIVVGTKSLSEVANTFKNDYEDLTKREITVVNGTKESLKSGDIFLTLDENEDMLGKEGYYIDFGGEDSSSDYTIVRAYDKTGIYYGTISILHILKLDEGRNDLSRGLVKDYPKFEQRGFNFDVARKFIPMEYLKDVTKQMSWYKLNLLSLHLSDDDIWEGLSTENGSNGAAQGWFRLESDRYPELNQHGGEYYTKEEFRDFQKYASDTGILVIPELDTPGHALVYTQAWPGTQRPDNKKYLDVTNPEVLEKVKGLFDEYILGCEEDGYTPTFTGPIVNIGTDEYKTNRGGLSDEERTKYREGFRAYTDALLKHIKSRGKEAAFWGSLRENNGTTPVTNDAIMYAWYSGYADAKKSLDAGYKIISMEDQEVYIVPGGGAYPKQFGHGESIYNSWLPNNNRGWSNVDNGWARTPAPEAHPGVLGGQFAVWNDFHGNGISVQDISYRIQHSMYALAEKCWGGNESKDSGITYDQLKATVARLGDAPNADFLYEIDKKVKDNEIVKLDDEIKNEVTKNTGASLGDSNNVTAGVAGKNGNALKFNGGSSYIETDLKSTGFGWSASMWINPVSDGVLMKGKTGTLRLENGKIKYDVEQYTHVFDCNIKNGQWNHIVLTGTYEGVKLYLNGELFESLVGKPYPNYNFNSGCDSWDGGEPRDSQGRKTVRYFQTLMLPMETIGSKEGAVDAVIDEFNIYNKVLSTSEIKALAGNGEVSRDNLALNKNATASGHEDARLNASKAVDGDRESNLSRWSAPMEDNVWFQVDLGESKSIDTVKIYWADSYSKEFKILVSEDGNNYTEIYTGEGKPNKVPSEITFDAINARYVKFIGVSRVFTGDGYYGPSFYEFEVYGEPDNRPKKNIALGKSVEVGNHNASMVGANAVDGKIGTRWEFAGNELGENYIKIPLNSNEDINKVVIKEKLWGSEQTRIKSVKIEVDGVETYTEANYTNDFVEAVPGDQSCGTKTIELGNIPLSAQEIVIKLVPKGANPDSELVNIREIELYGSVVEETQPENDSLIPHDTMEIFASDAHRFVAGIEGPAYLAIDGNAGTWWHTTYDESLPDDNSVYGLPQSITLDLKSTKTIGKYEYTPRSRGENGIITKYELQVSLDNKSYYSVTSGNWELNQDVKTITFDAVKARYVRLVALEAYKNVASASELNVYTATQTESTKWFYLDKIIEEIENLDKNNYLTSSIVGLDEALNKAKALDRVNANNDDIENAINALVIVKNKLILKGDRIELKEVYDEFIAVFEDLNQNDYVKSSCEDLKAALTKAKTILDGDGEITQKQIDNAKNEIRQSHENLINLSDLRNLINKAELISLEDCTITSAGTLKASLNKAKEEEKNENTTLYDVTIATYKLQDAINNVVGDSSALNEVIAIYDHEDKYTQTSWVIFVEVLNKAKEVANNVNATPQQLKEARLLLLQAADKLEEVGGVNLDVLKELINVCNRLEAIDYTTDSWEVFVEVLNRAKAVVEDSSSVSQTQVNELTEELNKAKEALVRVEETAANKIALGIAIEIAGKINEKDLDNVVPAVVTEFINALEKAKTIYDNDRATQDEVNKAFDRLANAMHMLGFFKGDKTQLQNLVTKINGLSSNEYTTATWSSLQTVLKTAENVLADLNVMQPEVNEIYTELIKAFLELRLVPNKDLLNELINKAEMLDARNYSVSAWNLIQDILVDARNVLNDSNTTQEEVDAIQAALKKAIAETISTSSVEGILKPGVNESKETVKTGDNSALGVLLLSVTMTLSAVFVCRKHKED